MNSTHEKLAKILRAKPEALLELEEKLNQITGKSGVLDKIMADNETAVRQAISDLNLTNQATSQEVYQVLVDHLKKIDIQLFNFLGKPDLAQLSRNGGKLVQSALKINHPKRGYFIRKDVGLRMLEKYPPENILKFFGYKSVAELMRIHDFSSVFSALRFAQDKEWMHAFFDNAYTDLTEDDFEEREVEIKVLEPQWLKVAEQFLEKKYHNVSHLKEFGVIFIIPLKIDTPGETLRLFTLILHYLNEVPFYSKLFKKFSGEPDFTIKLKSLLRGDVPEGPTPSGGLNLRIVQRYLAKDDESDFRLLEPHVNPEAEHWYRAEGDLAKLAAEGCDLGAWQNIDFVGNFFPNASGIAELISFDLIDLVMSLVKKGEIKYLYHQQEALWNKIIVEYFGREKMNELIEQNIIGGFIKL